MAIVSLILAAAVSHFPPNVSLPGGRAPDEDLDRWEVESGAVETMLKRRFCPALMRDGRAVQPLFAGAVRISTFGGLGPERRSPSLSSQRRVPAGLETVSAEEAARRLEVLFAEVAMRERCKAGLIRFAVSRDKPKVARGRVQLRLAGWAPDGRPVLDTGLVTMDFALQRGAWRITALDFEPRLLVFAPWRRFRDVTAEVGVPRRFRERPAEHFTQAEFDRGSVAVGDADGDGDLDLYVGADGANLLLLNDGKGHFVEQGRALGVADAGNARGVLFADLDGDGNEDIVVANRAGRGRPGEVVAYENRGQHRWRRRVLARSWRGAFAHLAAGDIDGDGDLDLHVSNYSRHEWTRGDEADNFLDARGGRPDLLLVNRGGWRFANRAKAWGVADDRWTNAGLLVDLSGDGRPELVTADDFGPKRIYLNLGSRFVEVGEAAGPGGERGNGMGIDVRDLDRNGYLDLYFTNMESKAGTRLGYFLPLDHPARDRMIRGASGNTLWMGQGDLVFHEEAAARGVAEGGWGWSARFVDVDLRGSVELAAPCGFLTTEAIEDF
ncbi:MAG: VCBS repeat-containing protein [Deltaproteobacteria bacterium]|nr:MAG: VCBS repeat-containing protein [Deltaproteobacteria bacterium]